MKTPRTYCRLPFLSLTLFAAITLFPRFPLIADPITPLEDAVNKVEGYTSTSTEGKLASRILVEIGEGRAFYKEEGENKNTKEEDYEYRRSFGLENSFFMVGEVKTGDFLREISSCNAYSPGSSVFSENLLSLNIDPKSYGLQGCDILLVPESSVFPSAHLLYLHSSEEFLQAGVYTQGEIETQVPKNLLGVTLLGLQTQLLEEAEEDEDWWYEEGIPPLREQDLLHLGGRLSWDIGGTFEISFMNTLSLTPLSPPANYSSLQGKLNVAPYKGSSFELQGNCQLWDRNFISTRGDRPKYAFHGGISLYAAFLPRIGVEGGYCYTRGFSDHLWGSWIPREERIWAGTFFGFSIIDVHAGWTRESEIEKDGEYTLDNELHCGISLELWGLTIGPSATYEWEKEEFHRSVYDLDVRGASPYLTGEGSLTLEIEEELWIKGRTSWEVFIGPVTMKISVFTLQGFCLSGEEECESDMEEAPGLFDHLGLEITGIISYSKE